MCVRMYLCTMYVFGYMYVFDVCNVCVCVYVFCVRVQVCVCARAFACVCTDVSVRRENNGCVTDAAVQERSKSLFEEVVQGYKGENKDLEVGEVVALPCPPPSTLFPIPIHPVAPPLP